MAEVRLGSRLVPRIQEGEGDGKESRATIERAIDSSPSLRNKKDLVHQFDNLVSNHSVDEDWRAFIAAAKRAEELDRIIADEGFKPTETRARSPI